MLAHFSTSNTTVCRTVSYLEAMHEFSSALLSQQSESTNTTFGFGSGCHPSSHNINLGTSLSLQTHSRDVRLPTDTQEPRLRTQIPAQAQPWRFVSDIRSVPQLNCPCRPCPACGRYPKESHRAHGTSPRAIGTGMSWVPTLLPTAWVATTAPHCVLHPVR